MGVGVCVCGCVGACVCVGWAWVGGWVYIGGQEVMRYSLICMKLQGGRLQLLCRSSSEAPHKTHNSEGRGCSFYSRHTQKCEKSDLADNTCVLPYSSSLSIFVTL